jgi:hypothetical protein
MPAKKAARVLGRTSGHQGDIGEMAFMLAAARLGFALALPYGHIHRYDFIVESGKNLLRVQVKTTTFMVDGWYQVCIRRNTNRSPVAYAESEVDFVAVYIIPEDTWYIVPVREIVHRQSLRFRPKGHQRTGRHDYYREAWHLLREPDGLVFG